jgi:ketosteroid isomerase-like protein
VEFFSVLANLEGQAFTGHDGIRRYFEDVRASWDVWRVELERVEEAPDGRLAVGMTMRLRGRSSGAAFERRVGHVWDTRDGKLLRCTPFDDPAEPFRATGLG